MPEWLLRFFCYLCGAEIAGAAELTMPSWLRALEGGELVRIGSNTFLGGHKEILPFDFFVLLCWVGKNCSASNEIKFFLKGSKGTAVRFTKRNAT